MAAPVNILHLHSSFDLGGKEARAVRLMNAFGDRAKHTIVSGVADALGAQASIAKGIRYEIAQNPPPLTGKPSVARYEAIAQYMRRFDLVLSYNWGAIDGAMARRAFGKGAPPLVHHEDGFNADEAGGLKIERNIYRRLALGAAHALAVPSEVLEAIALKTWKQPRERVHRIVNGIGTAYYAQKPEPKAIPGFVPKAKEVVIGALAGLREVKDLTALVRAVGGVSGRVRLVIVGEGPERARIAQAAAAMGMADTLVLPGFLDRPYRYIGHFDILALSSRSEQFPISVVEAMAAGLPIASYPVGDVARMVAPENLPFITEAPSEVRLRDALQALVADPALRASIGAANQRRARAEFDESVMIARYSALYEEALGRPGSLT
ncbi:glycosyltransferase family 4 protein [Sphingomonas sp. PvP018]|uniref:glycosyltransferase family 4 protein n=1 Tax=Sphingomonas sp. PvP018 TaxID=2817852 RepID=UPI001AE5E01C|nr:glycosyltransferase family 4 protein [Sphingomonas sp. PvP018]MBP2515085.1 glycosyltransferase involved in cell wall biosynthesis [Sphingomonas sp. PvP018]